MFLKSLTLKGFKSFADTTMLELQSGVCVVVGPNGSGKSNVVDAIGWVLGAQAPSAVRSQKMDDVIFAGSPKRPALGRAEVALTIDNSAGLLPIEFSEVTITRTLFRNGDSEYAINGAPCRLLDVQELLSDSGVGRQQHVIISQGQIDAVLNARPEERRLIIEEAAGVLKFRRRKEKAERRLLATEGNLTRVQDLLREVRRQLRPLQRQADAARRHGSVVAELTALRIFVAGRDLASLRTRLESAAKQHYDLSSQDRDQRKRLGELDTEVLAAEAELSAHGGHDLGDTLVLFESLNEQARGLRAVLTERRRGIDRARDAFVDQAVVATLETEAARLAEELVDVEQQAAELAPGADWLAAAEADLAEARAAFASDWPDAPPAPSGETAEARGELAALRAGVDRSTNEIERMTARIDGLDQRRERLAADVARLRSERASCAAEATTLDAAVGEAQAERNNAEAAQAEAEEERRRAESGHHRWTARADALAQALDAARARAGAAKLAEVAGVVGTLLDLVEIDEGWESAFEAAAADALAAVVVEDADAARRALAVLREGGGGTGAVLPLGVSAVAAGGAAAVDSATGGAPLRNHVRSSRPDVDLLLDSLVANAVVVGAWPEAIDVVLAHPGTVAVTRSGDRLGTTGWRVGQAASGATGAALDEARGRAQAADSMVSKAVRELATVQATCETARQSHQDAVRAADRNQQRIAALDEAIPRAERELADEAGEADGLVSQRAEVSARAARDAARLAELEVLLPELEAVDRARLDEAEAMASARARLEAKASEVGALRSDLDMRGAGLGERREFLQGRLRELEARLVNQRDAREQAEARRLELDQQTQAVDRLTAFVLERHQTIERHVAELRDRRRRQSEVARQVAHRLDELRKERAGAERALEAHRERQRRVELEEAELKLRVEQAVETLRRELDTEPDTALAATAPELAEGVSAQARVRELERELRIMGPINPLALEEFEALQERHTFLEDQLEDVKASRRELSKVIRGVDAEIVRVFAAAYADVESNFRQLFETLFPGGSGRLRLTETDNLLDTGIDVEARPSGKNVRKLSLLSGGERSLTALAYLFAVFRARPSPFYVMDEVEAALDDVNLHRFLDLVAEFRTEAQLIIVSHQKRTMEAADVLYGVTMQPGGSSRVVSERAA